MPKIIFAAAEAWPGVQPSDQLVADCLIARGAEVVSAPWTGDRAVFDEADLVVIRSTWDYHDNPRAFRQWIGEVAPKTTIENAPMLLFQNLSKRYLMHLGARGAPLPPTRFCAPKAADLANAMDQLGVGQAVAKPVVSASARGLSVIDRDDDVGLEAAAAALGGSGIVQPIIEEIKTRGETSVVFFDGAYSHAVVKRPREGDIRVQHEYGGVVARVDPEPWVIDEAQRILDMLPDCPAYARIDIVVLDAAVLLMEVELVEPELFITHAPEAADRLAACLWKKL